MDFYLTTSASTFQRIKITWIGLWHREHSRGAVRTWVAYDEREVVDSVVECACMFLLRSSHQNIMNQFLAFLGKILSDELVLHVCNR